MANDPTPSAVEAAASEPHWWDAPAAAFDAWLREQPEDVQEMGLLEQIDLYAQTDALAARGAGGEG